MSPNQAIKHYESMGELAYQLGVTYQAVSQWVKKGEIPEGRQYQLEVLTKGKLKADRKRRRTYAA